MGKTYDVIVNVTKTVLVKFGNYLLLAKADHYLSLNIPEKKTYQQKTEQKIVEDLLLTFCWSKKFYWHGRQENKIVDTREEEKVNKK